MPVNRSYTVVGLGELLWDLLPGGKQLGGAPANFAYHSARLGDAGIIASRVGDDALGQEAIEQLKKLKLSTSHIQLDQSHPTGAVSIRLDENGQPDYTITENVAWDFLQWTLQWDELAAIADVVCFGSLAQRAPESQNAIRRFLEAAHALIIFDVNLRQSFYSAQMLHESFALAEVVKMNHEELIIIMRLLELGRESVEEGARKLLQMYKLKLVCITRGSRGSLLVSDCESAEHPGLQVTVADTIGAGDAFTAALAHHYIRGSSLQRMNEAANKMGAEVAARAGAMPSIEHHILEEIIQEHSVCGFNAD